MPSYIFVIGSAAMALTILLRKRGPFGAFSKLRKFVGAPLLCEVCAPAWVSIVLYIIYQIATLDLPENYVILLYEMFASIGVTYLMVSLSGGCLYPHSLED